MGMTLSLKSAGLLALTFCATCLSALNLADLQVGTAVYKNGNAEDTYVVSDVSARDNRGAQFVLIQSTARPGENAEPLGFAAGWTAQQKEQRAAEGWTVFFEPEERRRLGWK